MIASENIRYYLDPLQSPLHTGEKMLVFREKYPRSYDSCTGKVVPVAKRIVDDHHLWWVHEDGRYVDGALQSPKELTSYATVLGVLDENVFVVGDSYGLTDDGRMVIRDGRRSDGKVLPGREGQYPTTYTVDVWYQAADWAKSCLPQPGDTQDIVDLQTTLARQRFERRLGEICILREANNRDWREDLEGLDYTLPTPAYAVAVSGSIFMPMPTAAAVGDLPESTRESLQRIAERNFRPGSAQDSHSLPLRAEVPVQLVVRTSFEKYEQVEQVGEHTIRSAVHDRFGIYDAAIGSVTKTPLLRSAH